MTGWDGGYGMVRKMLLLFFSNVRFSLLLRGQPKSRGREVKASTGPARRRYLDLAITKKKQTARTGAIAARMPAGTAAVGSRVAGPPCERKARWILKGPGERSSIAAV